MRKNKKISPRDCIIKGINTDTGEEDWFLNVASAVKVIGCTRPQAYNVLNKVGYCKTAKGWRLEWVDFNDVSVVQSKQGIKVLHEDGDQVSEAEYWQLVDNMLK